MVLWDLCWAFAGGGRWRRGRFPPFPFRRPPTRATPRKSMLPSASFFKSGEVQERLRVSGQLPSGQPHRRRRPRGTT
eukprot:7284851-Pyramimonas_sp.AAC.1